MESNNNYSELLNDLWHKMINIANQSHLKKDYPRIQGLGHLEIGVINIVSHKPDIIFREICDELNMPKSSLTNVIDKLEKRNYVKRIISKRDKRSFSLELTVEGNLAQKEHLQFESFIFNKMMNALDTDEEKQLLIHLIGKIVIYFNNSNKK